MPKVSYLVFFESCHILGAKVLLKRNKDGLLLTECWHELSQGNTSVAIARMVSRAAPGNPNASTCWKGG
jgi:hypothetical protein